MLKPGDKITIRFSKNLGNKVLVNRTGIVTSVHKVGNILKGANVDVVVMRRTRNYYIPVNSIEGPNEVNKIRTLSLLKSTVL